MSLEQKISQQPSIWDSIAAAYSSSKAVKVGLMALEYSYGLAAVASVGFYVAARSIYAAIKGVFKLMTFQYNSAKEAYDDIKDAYNPFGKVKRSTILGSTLGSISHITGF